MPGVIGSNHLNRNNVAERDYLKSFGDIVRTATNSTQSNGDAPGATLIETLGGADNDQCIYRLLQKIDLSAAGARGRMRVKIRFTEANTNDMDWFVGLSSGLSSATGTISNTASQITSGDHLGVTKLAESMFFGYIGAANATHTARVATTVAFASATTYVIEIRWQATAAGIDAQYYVDGVLIGSVTEVAYTNWGSVFAGVQFKASSANAEIMQIEEMTVGNTHR